MFSPCKHNNHLKNKFPDKASNITAKQPRRQPIRGMFSSSEFILGLKSLFWGFIDDKKH